MSFDLVTVITLILPVLLFSLVVHEMAHAIAADRLGDPTARMLGRISFNPLVHLDPVMSVVIPGLLIMAGSPVIFGGAKPVPVNYRMLKDPRKAMALIALAGPLSNVLIAAVCYFILKILIVLNITAIGVAADFLMYGLQVNVALAVFNMMPVPPLDGSRVLAAVMPGDSAQFLDLLERYGLFLVFLLVYTGVPGMAIQFVWNLIMPFLFSGIG